MNNTSVAIIKYDDSDGDHTISGYLKGAEGLTIVKEVGADETFSTVMNTTKFTRNDLFDYNHANFDYPCRNIHTDNTLMI